MYVYIYIYKMRFFLALDPVTAENTSLMRKIVSSASGYDFIGIFISTKNAQNWISYQYISFSSFSRV